MHNARKSKTYICVATHLVGITHMLKTREKAKDTY